MKKLIALVLVFCMVISLGACKKPAEQPGGSTGQTENAIKGTSPAAGTESADMPTETTGVPILPITDNSDLINPEKFGGKMLEIYGYASTTYDNIENMDGSIGWMVRAAIDEWAALNNVEIDFVSIYDQSIILGDMGAGGKPDLLLYCDKIPLPEGTHIVRPLTDAEYKELARTCGETYLKLITHNGENYGVQHPWAGGKLFRYNKTLFEENGIKSPGEYFMEDNWNWDTFEICMTEISKVPGVSPTTNLKALTPEFYYRHLDEKEGFLTSIAEESKEFARFMEIYNNLKDVCPEQDIDWKSTASAFENVLWYDYADMHQVLENGDVIEAVPVPKFANDAVSFYNHDTTYSAILSSCDEPEATLSLLNYVLRVGMRYMSDYSLGLYKCNYEGIRGATAYSLAWKNKIAEMIAQRQTEFDKLTDWDHEQYLKTQAYIFGAERQFPTREYPFEFRVRPSDHYPYNDKIELTTYENFLILERAWIEVYNELWVWIPG